MFTRTTTTVFALALTYSLTLTGCLRFSDNKKEEPKPTSSKVTLKTMIYETGDPLKPYKVDISVNAPKYNGLVLVKATEQIIIGKPGAESPSPSGLALAPSTQSIAYNQLKTLDQPNFKYTDTNVNPLDIFWYAVIKPDASGTTGQIQEEGTELPEPNRVQLPAAKTDPTVVMTTAVEATGTGLRPYVVKIDITAPISQVSALRLVRASSASALNAGSYNVLANVTSSPFQFTDNTVYPTNSVVYGVINENTAQAYVLPTPASVTLPAMNNTFASLALTQIKPLGQMPSSKLTFDPVAGRVVLKKLVNGLEVASITLASGQTEYTDSSVDFDKNYSYQLIQYDYYDNAAGQSAAMVVNYAWPLIDFTTEFVAELQELSSLHQYRIRAADLSTIKRILQIQLSGDGINYSTVETFTDTSVTRSYSQDFSAPAARYFRIRQIDRNNTVLKTSNIYNVSIPEDKEFTGTTTLAQNFENMGRVKLTNATLYFNQLQFTISGKKLISDNGVIRAYPVGQKATSNTDGRLAGAIELEFKTATGSLTLDARGEAGGDGTVGANGTIGSTGSAGGVGNDANGYCNTYYSGDQGANVTELVFNTAPSIGQQGGQGGTGTQGGQGLPGKKGGDGGLITLTVHDSATGFTPNYLVASVNGGAGGAGGPGGAAGPGGAGGRGGQNCFTHAQQIAKWGCSAGANACYYNNGQTYHTSGSQGASGSIGAQGPTGTSGAAGAPAQRCIQLPGQTSPSCY